MADDNDYTIIGVVAAGLAALALAILGGNQGPKTTTTTMTDKAPAKKSSGCGCGH
jgi:hypothetical protein